MIPGKRVALAIGVPLAALAMLGGSVAFAASQQADPTPSSPATPTDPAQPGGGQHPRHSHDGTQDGRKHDCPNMDGSNPGAGHGGSNTSSPQTGFHNRARGSTMQARYQ